MKAEERALENSQTMLDKNLPEEFKVSGMDFSLVIALAKKDATEISCLKFKRKYGMDYSNFVQRVLEKKRTGNFDMFFFEMNDDLMAWEFAEAAKHWWSGKIKKMTIGNC